MKKIRAIGFILIVLGIAVQQFFFENDGVDFITGVLLGAGFALLITGQIKKNV